MKYKSCEWINQGIHFDVDKIKMCCYYSTKSGGNTVIYDDYKGESINWDDFFSFKQKIKDSHKKGIIYPKCQDCINLTEQEWDDSKNFINKINLDYFTNCNSKCVYCFTMSDKEHYNKRKSYNFLPILKDMIKRGIYRTDAFVNWGGGEVTMLKEFDKTLNTFLETGIDQIRIHSSGILYSKAIERGLKQGILDIIITADAGTNEMHKKIKQVDSYKKVWDTLKRYVKNQKTPNLVICKYNVIPGINDNKVEIVKWLEKTKSIGINYVMQEIESTWFYSVRENVPSYMYELFDFTKEKANEMGLKYELYERAKNMMNEKKQTLQ